MAEQRKFQAIKGVRDILPPESALWNRVEQTAREVFATYGYGEIRLPMFEDAALFARSVGLDTDIVSKETFTFADVAMKIESQPVAPGKSGIKLSPQKPDEEFAFVTLRPEATASVCRAYIDHGMHTWPGNVKLYYIGPMFRRERPQKGRYRQFYQIGAEVLTPAPRTEETEKERSVDAAIDAEVIEMLMVFFDRVGLGSCSGALQGGKEIEGGQKSEVRNQKSEAGGPTSDLGHPTSGVTLYINSIGCKECRPKYVAELKAALEKARDKLGPDSQRRIETNPLRVLDSKLPEEQAVIEKLPRITEHLCAACREHYAELKKQLEIRGVAYQENWRLVRGLDYYMRTTFEITAPGLGAQNAVCGGGRYDGLVELLGGPPTKGIGFAIGTDRLILSLQEVPKAGGHPSTSLRAGTGPPLQKLRAGETPALRGLDVFVAWMGQAAQPEAIKIARRLRDAGLSVEVPAEEMKFKKSIGLADKLHARYALIIGENELKEGKYALKRLADGVQTTYSADELVLAVKKSGE